VEAINNKDLVVSPIVELELTYLHEIGRLTVNGPTILGDLVGRIGLSFSEQTTAAVVQAAGPLSWTPRSLRPSYRWRCPRSEHPTDNQTPTYPIKAPIGRVVIRSFHEDS
jgi:hypothetical protein